MHVVDQTAAPGDGPSLDRVPRSGLTETEELSFHPDYLAALGTTRAIELLRVLPSTSSDLIVVYDDQAKLVYANPAAERILGFRSVRDVDRNILELVHPDDQERCIENLLRALATPGLNPPAIYRVRTASSGAWKSLEVVATNCLDDPRIEGVVLTIRDVTKTVELSRAYATFGHANQMLLHATSEQELLQRTCEIINEVGGYAYAWIGVARDDEQRTVVPIARAGRTSHLDGSRISWADNEDGQGPVGRALRSKEPHTVRDLVASEVPEDLRPLLDMEGLRACCALPIDGGDGVDMILVIADSEVRDFEEEEMRLFSELTGNLAFGLRDLRSAAALGRSEERFRTLASSSPIGILESNAEGLVSYSNERMADIAGTTPESLLQQGWISVIDPRDRRTVFEGIREWNGDGIHTWRCRINTPAGVTRHVQAQAAARSANGLEHGVVVTVADVTEEVRAQDELTRLALVDPLTSLPNRTQFLIELRKRLRHHRRATDELVILFLDLDHLKLVNDSLGHDAGDAVILEAARRFGGVLRSGEVAARFGGDEFMFLVQGGSPAHASASIADRLLNALSTPFEVRGVQLSVSCSIGVAIGRRGDSAESLVRDADTAMYRAKELGRNRTVIFDDQLRQRTVARLAIESDLARALERDELYLNFQPIVDPRTGRPSAAEALLRWRHPERGIVPPLEFIHVAEDLGIITDIGSWVFEEAAAQLARWDQAADGPHVDYIAVNVSTRQLDFCPPEEWIVPALDRTGIEPSRLEIEVTESVAMGDLAASQEVLRALRQLGLTIALDDFGTGYSSLSYLHELPISTVKIDRSFIERIVAKDGSLPIVRAIVEMSHAMGLRVVAEGVSTAAIHQQVADIGCDLAQGFRFAKPMPAEQFGHWWKVATGGVHQGERATSTDRSILSRA